MYARPAGMSDDDSEDEYDFSTEYSVPKPCGNFQQTSKAFHTVDPDNEYEDWSSEDEKKTLELRVIDACMIGNLEVIKKYLEAHEVNDFLHSKWTLLLYATFSSQCEVVEYLLNNGANVNKHRDGYTPLTALCNSDKGSTDKRIECLRLLLKAKANTNAINKQRETPLMHACKCQEAKFVTELIEHVDCVNARDNREKTALFYAVIANKPDVVKVLLDYSADVSLCDYNNLTVKEIAITKGYKEIFSLLTPEEDEIMEDCSVYDIRDWRDFFPSLVSSNNEFVNYDVSTVLIGMGLENYKAGFKGVDIKTFFKLTEEDLKSLGVDIKGHRRQFMDHLHRFHRKKWSVQSLGIIKKSEPYTIYDGVISLGTITRQIVVMGSSFHYIKNNMIKAANDDNAHLTQDQISQYKIALRNTQNTLGILKKELLQMKSLAWKINKTDAIAVPASYIGPKKNRNIKISWHVVCSVTIIAGVFVYKTPYVQRLVQLM